MTLVDYALVTLDDLKLFMRINVNTSDERLKYLINQATDFIERYCQRRFTAETYTNETYDGDGTDELFLKNWPVISFTSLSYNGAHNNSGSFTVIDTEDYWVNTAGGYITKSSIFNRGTQNYRATYQAGYTVIPYDLQWVCCMLASEAYSQSGSAGIKSESLGDHSITFEAITQSNPRTLSILNSYRRFTMAPAY